MRRFSFLITAFLLVAFHPLLAQKKIKTYPDKWTASNREVKFDEDTIMLSAAEGDGVLWLNKSKFKNGIIELDIKGENTPGRSFVGFAFHGVDMETFDAIYFRPFNFQNEQRRGNSLQYISLPEYEWSTLRKNFPGKYENPVEPIPDPSAWFHAKIVVSYPSVKVYVDGSSTPSLEVEQISEQRKGMIGLWVGNNSRGWFKNITIKKKK